MKNPKRRAKPKPNLIEKFLKYYKNTLNNDLNFFYENNYLSFNLIFVKSLFLHKKFTF